MATLSKKTICLFNATELAIYKLEHSDPLYITPDFIRSLHKQIYAYYRPAAGNFRTPVYGAIVGSKTFKPVPPNLIVAKLLNVCEFINNKKVKSSLYKKHFTSKIRGYSKFDRKSKRFWFILFCGSFVHHQIACIHPFTGGNGRLARLLMSMELANHGLYKATYPPFINEAILLKRSKYLDALGKADGGNYMDFCVFLARILEDASKIAAIFDKKKTAK